MLKISMLLNAAHPAEMDLSFPAFLAEEEATVMNAVFFEEDSESGQQQSLRAGSGFLRRGDDCMAEEEFRGFREACLQKKFSCHIHRRKGMPLVEMITVSRLSDVVMVDPATSFRQKDWPANDLAENFLKRTECPVIFAPSSFSGLHKIVFICDGTASSIAAIKQLVYLFPCFTDHLLEVIYSSAYVNNLAYKKEVAEWLNDHFSQVSIKDTPSPGNMALQEACAREPRILAVMGMQAQPKLLEGFYQGGGKAGKLPDIPVFMSRH